MRRKGECEVKFFLIPAAALALLFSLSLWNAKRIEEEIKPWCTEIETAAAEAERGNWDTAEHSVRTVCKQWNARNPSYHIVTAHDELDTADALFTRMEAFAAGQDEAEFCAEAAELVTQLRVISEMQKLTVRNIF